MSRNRSSSANTYDLTAYTASEVYLFGGSIGRILRAQTSANIDWSGGYLGDDAVVWGSAVIRGGELSSDLIVEGYGDVEIVGSDFQLWGQPLPLGEVTQTSGLLTGTLENGDLLNVYISRNQFDAGGGQTVEGRITLVPEPGATLMLASAIGCLAAMRLRRSTR